MKEEGLIAAVAKDARIKKADATRVIRAMTDIVTKELKKGGRANLAGFGTFSVEKRAKDRGRKPKIRKTPKIPRSSMANREPIKRERERRIDMWDRLRNSGGPTRVSSKLLRDLGIYGGAQGVWVDCKRTSNLTEDGKGVTVGLLHTGKRYSDDFSEDAVLYHYPKTNRPRNRDLSEIDATKAARRFYLPVFVITHPPRLFYEKCAFWLG
jgi:nucleoid DNA-binding protein